jgi:hypothetical protein
MEFLLLVRRVNSLLGLQQTHAKKMRQNYLRNKGFIFQDSDRVILDKMRMYIYEAFKIKVLLKNKLLHFSLKITMIRSKRFFKR